MPLRTFVHDINESLHVIRLAAEATRFEQAEQRLTAERLDQRLQTILDQVQHLTALVGQMAAAPAKAGRGD